MAHAGNVFVVARIKPVLGCGQALAFSLVGCDLPLPRKHPFRLSSRRTAPLVRALRRVTDQLVWQYGYEKVPRGLVKKYGYAELMGTQGPVISDRLKLGLVLFAPNCTYPAHSHDGIKESYICLSGVVSESNDGVYSPGSLLFNPPNKVHRITTGNFEPTLLAYAWEGSSEKLRNQNMRFTRKQKK